MTWATEKYQCTKCKETHLTIEDAKSCCAINGNVKDTYFLIFECQDCFSLYAGENDAEDCCRDDI